MKKKALTAAGVRFAACFATSFTLSIAALSMGFVNSAAATSLEARYNLSLAGLTVGTAVLTGEFSPTAYNMKIRVQMSGIVTAITSGQGLGTAAGNVSGTKILSNAYAVTATTSKQTRTVQMAISNGVISDVVVNPPFDTHPDRIPVTEAHKNGVMDPISALVMPYVGTLSSASVCSRTMQVFDGSQRMVIAMSPNGEKQASGVQGYVGPLASCALRYTPISGHRPNRKAIQYMEANRDIFAWLAPVGNTNLAMPWRISVKTMIGTALLQATSFNVTP